MTVRQLRCGTCDVRIEGDLPLPNLARLSSEERDFVEVFLVCGGSLKQSGRVLGISYPTVRSRLDAVMARLRELRGETQENRVSVLEKLERGEINAREAALQLRLLSQ